VARGSAAFRASRCGFTPDNLVEIALLAAGGLVLHQQRKIVFVELLQPLVPIDGLKRSLSAVAGKIEADHPHILCAARAANTSRLRVALFRPPADFVMVG
jgi:hypothetical protein